MAVLIFQKKPSSLFSPLIKNSGFYIHYPFCIKKCGYCDFFSFKASPDYQLNYINALTREIIQRSSSPYAQATTFDTLYFGGGTPSLMDVSTISELIHAAINHYFFDEAPEVTLEVNPETITTEALSGWKAAGINRLSIGIQSFFESEQKLIMRGCLSNQLLEKLKLASRYFANISIDLIYDLPGQTLSTLETSLTLIPSFITHLSAYMLTIQPNTALHRKLGPTPTSITDDAPSHFLDLSGLLSSLNFNHYEISSFSKPGFESRHNHHYWQLDDYWGFGASAVSTIHTHRLTNTRNMQNYLQGDYCDNEELLSPSDIEKEALMLSLRTKKGLALSSLSPRLNHQLANHLPGLQNELEGCLTYSDDHLSLTPKGWLYSNSVIGSLFEKCFT